MRHMRCALPGGLGAAHPILWKLKEGDATYAAVIRKRKAAAYARRKRKAERGRA